MTTMKHLYYTLLLAGMAMLVTSCGKDEPTGPKDPDPTDPTEMYVKELRHALYGVRDADHLGPDMVKICLIRSNSDGLPFGYTVRSETTSATTLQIYDGNATDVGGTANISWAYRNGFTEQVESGGIVNVVPVVIGCVGFTGTDDASVCETRAFERGAVIYQRTRIIDSRSLLLIYDLIYKYGFTPR